MVQTKTVGSTISCMRQRQADRARLPVMWPHKSDGRMRRDGSNAASMQQLQPVDERGRLHVVPDLCRSQRLPDAALKRIRLVAIEKKRRSRILTSPNPQLRRQDKSADRGRAHVVGKIEEFINVTNTGCWRLRQIVQAFQCFERRRPCCAAGAPR